MVHLQVHNSVTTEYIFDFPEGAERSVKGSVCFRPGTVMLTDDEFKHISTAPQYTRLKGKFTVVSGGPGRVSTPPVQSSAANAPASVPTPPDRALETSGQALQDGTTPVDVPSPAEKRSKFRP